MTFQVGMVGSDGVLLASDKLEVTPCPVKRSSLVDKITVMDDLAFCWAGDRLCEDVVNKLSDGASEFLTASNPKELLMRYGQESVLREQDTRGKSGGRQLYGGVVLIARHSGSTVGLWQLNMSWPMTASRCDDKAYAGDPTNSACFFVEKYFPADHLQRPIKDLHALAAHTVSMAAATNPSFVRGLEIAECSQSRFRKLSGGEILVLLKTSQKTDWDTAAALGVRSQFLCSQE
jgi:hypothetical protein